VCKRAKAILDLPSVADAHTGAIAAVQRTDSALRLNVHFHILVLDGVYVRDATYDALVFHTLPTPTHAEVADIARRTAQRIEKILRAHGRSLDPAMQDGQDDEPPKLCSDEPGLAACYAAAARGVAASGDRAGQAPLRLLVSPAPAVSEIYDENDPVAEVRGVNLHARQCVDGRDRRQLERLCRYITRPPLAQDRLELRPDGKLELTLKSVWKDGTRAILLPPRDLIIRLIAAIPPPRFHLVRYFGVLSSHSKFRSEVVPKPPQDSAAFKPPPASGDQLEFPKLKPQTDDSRPSRKRWAWLLAHVFRADLDTCVRCGGPMRWLKAATTEQAATALLAKLGLAPQPPPTPPRVSLGQLRFGFC